MGGGGAGHGPVADAKGRGGPDADAALFPVDCRIVCSAPVFSGTVTAFDRPSGQHTLRLDDGKDATYYLGYLVKKCVITQGAACALHRVGAR